MGACNITLIAILEIFETSEKKVLAEKKVLVMHPPPVGSPAVDADLQLTNARPYEIKLKNVLKTNRKALEIVKECCFFSET